MSNIPRAALVVLLGMGCGGGQTPGDPSGPESVRLQEVVRGLAAPVHLAAPAGDPRLFVVEQAGRIRVVEGGVLRAAPFLDIAARVASGGERGLLSVAFHPRFAQNGWLYVYYTDLGGDIRVERYQANAARSAADPASAVTVLVVEHSRFGNHNGGLALFGPDGRLYVGTGDGGGAASGGPQDRGTLLGKLLRLDVDGPPPYAIPVDNPFVGQPGARGEVWAYGLRNPWRFAFDQGVLWIGDVGQNAWEEIDAVPASAAGLNFGWEVMEGSHCYSPSSGCDTTGKVLPVLEYPHAQGCSVTGGSVYRGGALPGLRGHYFYADYCQGWVRSFRLQGAAPAEQREYDLGDVGNITSFGTDAAGELYLTSSLGRVYQLVPAP